MNYRAEKSLTAKEPKFAKMSQKVYEFLGS